MKYLLSIFFLVSIMFIGQHVQACEIHFTVQGDKKENFKEGEEIIVKVDVIFTHRICPEGIENTKFKYEGVKVLGATKWKETSNGKWERKLKLKVIKGDTPQLQLEAIRKCDKEGGYGKITIKRATTA